MRTTERLAVSIPVPPYVQDHRFMGRAVYPAVEAMQMLAAAAKQIDSAIDITTMHSVRFEKLLEVPADGATLPALIEVHRSNSTGLSVALLTRKRLQKSGMHRIMTHARLSFVPEPDDSMRLFDDKTMGHSGQQIKIASRRIYEELVPFGPAYRNICEYLTISAKGAEATIVAPKWESEGPLGSPFPLDAAFHAACVWGQRYAGFVPFPVGLVRRKIILPTNTGETYRAHIVPREVTTAKLMVDLFLFDTQGRLCEIATGVEMRDVSQGHWQPPAWIQKGTR